MLIISYLIVHIAEERKKDTRGEAEQAQLIQIAQGPESGQRNLLSVILILSTILLSHMLSACSIFTIHGSGNVITETRDVRNFDRVSFSGTSELLLTQGGEESLIISADDNLMDHIESEVRGGTLFIGHEETISPSQPIRFRLSVREIVGLDVSGIAEAETGDIITERLVVKVSGLSTLSMGTIHAEKLAIHLSGSNEVELMGSGEVVNQEIVISGPSSYRAPALRSESADISISGPGNATVWATELLNVSSSGIGNIEYYGSPQVTQKGSGIVNLSGLGNP